ncbi:MAG: hypothetical protein ACI4HK_05590 [Ruminococcus sp.]
MKFITEEKTVADKDKDKLPSETETIFAEKNTGGKDEDTAL